MIFKNIFVVVGGAFILAACVAQPPSRSYPSPDSYLVGKNIEDIAQVYGGPEANNTIGKTLIIRYTGLGNSGRGFSNLCSLELQADSETNIIKHTAMYSNLAKYQSIFDFNIVQDCNRVFYRAQFAN